MLDRILIGSSAEPTDTNFKNVTLLLHGDGSNGAQNNTFIDSSTNNFTITRNGNTTQGSFSPYGSNWSNYFDGNGDYISMPSNAAFAFGTGDYTIEGWFYPTVGGIDQRLTWFSDDRHNIDINTSNQIFLYDGSIRTFGTVNINSWNHFAVSRSGGTVSCYLNGVRGYNASETTNSTTRSMNIGANNVANGPFNGYISNMRVVKGTAVYSGSTITVPTAPLTAITNTSLLTCADNRFRDGSTNNFTITRNGDVKVTNFAPFAPSSAYSTTTNGGSAYFDGSGDYLSTSSNTAFAFGTGDFAIECWVYRLDSNGTGLFESRGGTAGFLWYIDGANQYPRFYDQNTAAHFTGTVTVPVGAWTHLAVTRSSGTLYFWVNGQAAGSNAYTVNVGSTATLRFYASNDAAAYLGYGSNMRAVKGSAVYTAAFTPPSSPVTAITNTSLLLNATNAAIFDNSMKNDLETVGNAQISTSVKKFGTGSMAFDGSGDGLKIQPNKLFNFSGDFTVEFWAYASTVDANEHIPIQTWNTANGWLANINGSKWNFNFKGSMAAGTSTVVSGQWYHIAATRSGSTIRLFVNGTQEGTATNSATADMGTLPMYIGAGQDGAGQYWNGYIDDLRITNGVARYTANFTAPTAPFPNK